ncbi:MAG TPA: heme-binding protein [Pseudolabrys sp.]|jgi:uncharacterized protein GlcG (DUF336 family)|nr:heme-binding protein [Pseudolabrys sp.]
MNGEILMSVSTKHLAAVILVGSLASPASAELLVHKDLSYEIAKTMAEGALAECHKRGFNTSVVVVDRAGDTLVAMRYDNASPHTMENARRKAYTARTFRQTTDQYSKKLEAGDAVVKQQVTLPNVIAIPGGVPIKAGDDVIGGIGLSGSPGVDEQCVQVGIDLVKAQLK